MSKWHCTIDGKKYGPVSAQELRQWLAEGRLQTNDYVWTEGMTDWAPYSSIAELNYGGVPQQQTYAPVAAQQEQGNGMAVAGMVLGIVSVPMICLWPIGLICAIVGLCLGVAGKNRSQISNTGAGMAVAGIVLSCITIALILLAFIVGIGMISSVMRGLR